VADPADTSPVGHIHQLVDHDAGLYACCNCGSFAKAAMKCIVPGCRFFICTACKYEKGPK
jgi:hypothetical protein